MLSAEVSGLQRGFVVRGLVQGVGFRYWAAKLARRLGLTGTARNLADGAVEVHVLGPADDVFRFELRLREGPFAARVTSVDRIDSCRELPHEFRILR